MKLVHFFVILLGCLIASFALKPTIHDVEEIKPVKINWRSPSFQMYLSIKKYAEKYKIPEDIAFAFAWHETRYQGPNHLEYIPNLVSGAGALGPMQIMPVAGRNFCPGKYSDSSLLYDIDYNVHTSMKLIRYLKKRFGSWELAAGAYNTGRPVINDYARGVARGYYQWK